MRKSLISEVLITNPGIKIKYYMIREGENIGVEICKDNAKTAQCFLPGTPEKVRAFIARLADYAVMPDILGDCAEDYITENFSLKSIS